MRSRIRLAAALTGVLACATALAGCGDGDSGDATATSADGGAEAASGTASDPSSPTGAIPDDFPLAAGMGGPRDTVDTTRTGTGLRDLTLCGVTPLRGLGSRDRMVADNSGGESADTRDLVLLGSAGEATRIATELAALPATCHADGGNGGVETRTEVRESPFGPAPAAELVQTYVVDGERGPGATVVHVVPVGAALLVTSTYGQWPADDLEAGVLGTQEPLRATVAALDLFAEPSPEPTSDPTSDPTSEPTSDPSAGVTAIPADFPLAIGLPADDGETTVDPPSADGDGIGEVEVCGQVVWPHARDSEPGPTARLVTGASGPEYFDGRELIVHADADAAVAATATVRQAAGSCRRFATNQVWTVLDRDTGYDTVTVGLTYSDGLGSSVFQVTRVGSATLMVQTYGEGSRASLEGQADGVTETTGQIVQAMCVFTKTGC
jgi:hypothetical protein